MYKKPSASGGQSPPDSPPGALPLDPAGGSLPRPPFRIALRTLAMVLPPWQILDPPLGGKGGGHVPKARGVKCRGRDHDRAAQKASAGGDRQTDRHTHPHTQSIHYIMIVVYNCTECATRGLSMAEMDTSIITLRRLAEELNAECVELRRRQEHHGCIADLLVRERADERDFTEVR